MNSVYAATESTISIHLAAPVLGHFFGIPLTSTMVMVWFTIMILVGTALYWRSHLKEMPSKAQIVLEALIGSVYTQVIETLGSEAMAKRYFPIVATIFIFVLALNWIGLLPGVDAIGIYSASHGEQTLIPFLHPANTDLNITIGFALVAFLAIECIGILALGFLKYGSKFFNFSSPLGFVVGIIEFFSEIARLISFSFRLFGNIFAGKTLIVIVMFFVPFIMPVPFLGLEFFVGIIQAYIFATLTLLFIKMAVQEPGH
jgi:F-type H+-transporting ATPase subunit a